MANRSAAFLVMAKAVGAGKTAWLSGFFNFTTEQNTSGLCRQCTLYVQQWPTMLKRGQGLYLWGAIGSGKNHAAAVLANELIERHLVETLFLNVPEAAHRFREAIGDESNSDGIALLERMKQVELLVLDDLGVEKPSAWVSDLIYQVVDRSWMNGGANTDRCW
jgi:DNA replication protein DnaC